MTPEELARIKIDRLLIEAGWTIVDRKEYSSSNTAQAIRESLLIGNEEADYILFIDGKAIGVLEAKRQENKLSKKVVEQAEKYTKKLPNWCSSFSEFEALPMVYLSNGKELLFRNMADINSTEYQKLDKMHSPKEILKILGIKSEFGALPYLPAKGLRDCQFEAITNLEKSLRNGQRKALMVLATGAGKTYTACLAAYRLLAYTPTKRILFLVDRNNLGKQAEGEFGTFRLTENGDAFNTIYNTQRLRSKQIPKDANLVICTIQRLFAFLKGEEFDDSDEETKDDTLEAEEILPENPLLPSDFFQAIIVDECHRSIYGRWRKVLEYFNNAKLIGLTATPDPETTLPYFNQNIVVNYTLDESIADGINVDNRIYRIKTKVGESGGVIAKDDKYIEETKYTKAQKDKTNKDNQVYQNTELDRAIVNLEHIKLVLNTFKDAIYTDLYPTRKAEFKYIPKTLIFAKSDAHASDILKILKEDIFPDECEDFAQKITYSAGDTNQLIKNFRNDKEFRIAITVTLVATGTDIKPLEILLFMRDVNSESLYVQMKGRGVRIIDDQALKNVTPNATSKNFFTLVDAIGVTEHYKKITKGTPINKKPLPDLEKLLERISHGYLPDDYLRLLADRLSRINAKSNEEQKEKFFNLANISIKDIAKKIFKAFENNVLPEFVDVNKDNAERKKLAEDLSQSPKAREFLLILNAGFKKILLDASDNLISANFSLEEAKQTSQDFEKYITDNKDKIEALRILYNTTGEPITNTLLEDLAEKLKLANYKFNTSTLWDAYFVVYPDRVRKLTNHGILTDLIQLVRFAYKTNTELKSFMAYFAQRFELWCGQKHRPLTQTQIDIARQIAQYIANNGALDFEEFKDLNDRQLFAQTNNAYINKEAVDEMLKTLSAFILAAA